MNTEKIEKLKKGLTNSQIPESLREKIRQQISRLEAEDKANEPVTKAEIQKIEDKIEDAVEVAEKKEATAKVAKARTARTPRAKRTVASKAPTTRKPKAKKVVEPKTTGGKNTAMSLAKEIRKEGEKWGDALKRAGTQMKKGKLEIKKSTNTELKKLMALVKTRKELKGITGTNLKRDSKRKAKPLGKRVSEDGNVYYEYRDNRTDRLAPNYPKNAPLLAGGGGIKQEQEYLVVLQHSETGDLMNFNVLANNEENAIDNAYMEADLNQPYEVYSVKKYATGGGIKSINWANDDNKKLGTWLLTSVDGNKILSKSKNAKELQDNVMAYYDKKGSIAKMTWDEDGDEGLSWVTFGDLFKEVKSIFADGGGVDGIEEDIDMTDDYVLRVNKGVRPSKELSEAEWMAKHNDSMEARDYTSNARRSYEIGGNLAGHLGGGVQIRPTMLDGTSGTHYTGLVGETGALSSGEMFAGGGGVDSDKQFPLDKKKLDEVAEFYASRIKSGQMSTKKKRVMDDIEEYKKDLFLLEIGRKKPSDIIGTGYKGNTRKMAYTWLVEQIYIQEKILKLLENHSFADGGAVMSNQQVINDASQSYVNYYLGEGTAQGMYAGGGGVEKKGTKIVTIDGDKYVEVVEYSKNSQGINESIVSYIPYDKNYKKSFADGGAIQNQYAGRTPRDIWNNLSIRQRMHFLQDHEEEILEGKKLRYFTDNDLVELIHTDWFELDDDVKNAFAEHTSRGEYATGGVMNNYKDKEDDYARGGGIRTVNGREYSTGRNWTNDHTHHNKMQDYEVPMNKRR
jgi:hypothetical protein